MAKKLELGLPQKSDYDNYLEYVSDLGQSVLENNKAITKEIDRSIGAGYRSQSTVDAPKAVANTINARYQARQSTLADYLSNHPELIGLYDKDGKLII